MFAAKNNKVFPHLLVTASILLLSSFGLVGCAGLAGYAVYEVARPGVQSGVSPSISAYGMYDDKRLMGTIADDKSLASKIKLALVKDRFSSLWSVSVYCFYGNVFLVGEIPEEAQQRAVAIAQEYKPVTITPHWFSPGRSERTNIGMATSLRASLVGTKGLSSTRIETEVNAGRIVLLGVVQDMAEKELAIETARKISGVQAVTSYLLLPESYPNQQLPPNQPQKEDGQADLPPVMEKAIPAHDGNYR